MSEETDELVRRLKSEVAVLKELLAVQERTVLEQSERLEETTRDALAANHAKASFLANMSHEIRTPMNAIIGMTGLMLDGELPDNQRRRAEIVRRSSESLLSLINEILDFSKIEAGKLTIEPTPCDLPRSIEHTMQALAPVAAAKHIELILRLAPDLPRGVRVDVGRLRQILTNLVGNAIKFTSEGYVVAELGVLETDDSNVTVELTVRDTGIGIPADRLDQVFDSFEQADGTVTRKFGGTGLGLAITKQLIELMGGTVAVESTLGRGSTFTVRIPVALDKSAVEDESSTDLSGIRALVVDDIEVNRELLRERLEEWGFVVDTFAGGPAALAGLRKAVAEGQGYLLGVLDHRMPEMSGVELGVAIRKEPGGSNLRLLMFSSDEVPRDASYEAAHFVQHLHKPLVVGDLRRALKRAVASTTTTRLYGGLDDEPRRDLQMLPGARVLVVDDVEANCMVGREMLEAMGCRVDVAANGLEAVSMQRELGYDVILMDCQMPELDGYGATREIRRAEAGEGKRVPIVAMTASAMEADRQRCLDAGMDDYVSKPVDIHRLNDVVVSFTRNNPESAPASRPAADTRALRAKFNAVFVEGSRSQLDLLRAAIAANDGDKTRSRAHALRGSCGTLATPRILQLTRQIEDLGAQNRLDRVADRFRELEELLRTAQDAVGAGD